MTMNITRDYTAWMRQLQNQDLLTCDFCKEQHLFRYMAEHIEEKHLGQFIWQNNPPVFVHIYTCPDCMTPWTDEEFPENGDPYENAIAERVNGILKNEYDLDATFNHYQDAHEAVKTAVYKYNNKRPHASCDYMFPAQAQQCNGKLKKRWRPKQKSPPDTTFEMQK